MELSVTLPFMFLVNCEHREIEPFCLFTGLKTEALIHPKSATHSPWVQIGSFHHNPPSQSNSTASYTSLRETAVQGLEAR